MSFSLMGMAYYLIPNLASLSVDLFDYNYRLKFVSRLTTAESFMGVDIKKYFYK